MIDALLGVFIVFVPVSMALFVVCCGIHDEFFTRYTPTNSFPTPAAEEKARRLFHNSLSPEQCKEYNDHRRFTVVGNNTQKRYSIYCGSVTYNIVAEDGSRLCFLPRNAYYLPRHDIYLSQKLFLEGNETAALVMANKIPNLNLCAAHHYTYAY